MQLSATHGVAEPLSLDGHPQTSGPPFRFSPSPFRSTSYSYVSFQKKRVIICFSPDFLRILQKICSMMENSPILAVVVPCYKEEAVLHETHKRLSQLFDRLIQARQIFPGKLYIICKRRKHRPDMGYHQRTAPKYGLCLRTEPGRKRRTPECPAGRTQCSKRPLRDSHFH